MPSPYRSVFSFELKHGETPVDVAQSYFRNELQGRQDSDKPAISSWDGVSDICLPSGTRLDVVRLADPKDKSKTIRTGIFGWDDAIRYQAEIPDHSGDHQVRLSAVADADLESRAWLVVDVAKENLEAEDAERSGNGADFLEPPRIVEEVLRTRKAFDGGVRLHADPQLVLRHEVENLLHIIADQTRRLPIFVASSISPEVDAKWQAMIGRLTKAALGTANVYVVGAQAVDELNARLSLGLQVKGGHLRAFAPRLNMKDPARRHPLWDPRTLTRLLDSSGKPTEVGLSEIAWVPRARALEAPLPAGAEPALQLLDQVERKKRARQTVEERLAKNVGNGSGLRILPEAVARAAKSVLPEQEETASTRDEDVWKSLRKSLARWTGKSVPKVTEETIEVGLQELDERIVRGRETIVVSEQMLDEMVKERDALLAELAELKEEKDVYAAQLEAARQQLGRQRAGERSPLLGGLSREQAEALRELEERVQRVAVGTGTPGSQVATAFSFLAEKLDPLLQARLAGVLEGGEWPAVLEQMDVAEGREPNVYRRTDVAAQLRLLMRTPSHLGPVFENEPIPHVANAAKALEDIRKRLARAETVREVDVARSYDAVGKILGRLGDREASETAKQRRDEAFTRFVENGFASLVKEYRPSALAKPEVHVPSEEGALGQGIDVTLRSSGDETPLIGNRRLPFEPWKPRGRFPKGRLDALGDTRNQKHVQMLVEEITSAEGPIRMGRLIDLVAQEFNLTRLHSGRYYDIENQVLKAQVVVDRGGFVWPGDIDPKKWREFRPTPPGVDRPFDDISPEEIRNAALFILEEDPDATLEDLESAILTTFSHTRKPRSVRRQLRRVFDTFSK